MERLIRSTNAAVLACLCLLYVLNTKGFAESACTSGFMEIDVVMKRAEKLTSGSVSSNDFDSELRVIPDWNFNCSGNITSLLLGVDIRTGETKYPEVQTWRRNGNQFTRVDSRTIVLSPGTFSASGVVQYHLTTPLPVVAGDMIGVYQPNDGSSVVRFFYTNNDPDAPNAYRVNNLAQSPTAFSASTNDDDDDDDDDTTVSTRTGEYILLSVITDVPQCSSNFLPFETFKQKVLDLNIYGVTRRSNELRIFPNINFTCSGNLTNWIVASKKDNLFGAELQIWRRSNVGQNNYTLVGSSVLPVSSNSFVGVYNYTPSIPLEFQEGDILGVYQRSGSGRVRVYYQETTGPANYRYPSDLYVTPPLNIEILTGPSLVTDEYDYPLVTVEIATSTVEATPPGVSTTEGPIITSTATAALTETVTEGLVTTSLTSLFSSSESSSIMTSTTSVILTPAITSSTQHIIASTSSDGMITISTSTTTVMITSSSFPEVLPTSTQANTAFSTGPAIFLSSSIIAEGASSIGPAHLLSSSNKGASEPAIVLSSSVIAQDKSSIIVGPPLSTSPIARTTLPTTASAALGNTTPIVVAVVVVLVAAIIATFVVILTIAITKRKEVKENKFSSNEESIQLNRINQPMDMYNPVYDNPEISPQDLFKSSDEMYENPCASEPVPYEQPISSAQWGSVVPTMSQRKAFTDPESHYEADEESYSRIAQISDNQSRFFEEAVVYWTPGSDCVTIYEQLAQKRFREIARDQVDIQGNIGSGQFGSVEKGVWHSPEKSIDVALKTLRDDASEQEKVKFLQEAAIMGQFHHPNIVKLHGVVTVGEPTMIVLELVENGDLRACLRKVRPIPGEMAASSLPHQLLGYCRQIASGMEYLSKKSFVHRDLAARNILVDDKRMCKIADFGLSRDVSEDDVYVSQGGMVPVRWTAPEALHYKKYSTASDVWGFGVLMYEIWSLGHKPFEGKMNYQVIQLIDSGYRLPPPPGCPRSIYQIMMDCWNVETSERPSFASLVTRLSQPENQLLKWTDRDKSVTNPQSTMLGAPLETASDLHSDIQQH